MKRKLLTLAIGFILSANSFGQEMTSQKAEEFYKTANWIKVVVDTDEVPYFIDSGLITRIRDIVAFRTKSEKRDTVKYHTFLGGCDDNRVMQTNGFAVYPGSSEFVPLNDKRTFVVERGTIGYILLEYACKNAKIENIKIPSDKEQLEIIELGNNYEKNGRNIEAIAEYTRVIQINPNHPVALINRGNVYIKLGKFDFAVADYTKVIQVNPKLAILYLGRGRAYLGQDKYDLAIADFAKAVELKPTLKPQINAQLIVLYNNRGQNYSDQGKYELAIADYTKAIKLNSQYDGSYLNRGAAYGMQGRFALAITDFTIAIKLNPQDAKAFRNRAYVYCLSGKKALAKADEKKVIEMGEKLIKKCE